MPEPRELTVELPALTVAALAWGPEDGPLALCLHGFPDTAWTWRHLGPVLAERGWRVVAPFTRGYAPTGPASDGDYRVGALMTDALDLGRALDANADAVLVGHDWGAVTAYGISAHAPAMFGRVVAMAVPPIDAISDTARANWRIAGAQVLRSWYTMFNQLPALPERVFEPLVRLLWRRWSPGYDATDDLALLAEAMPDHAHRKAALTYYRHTLLPRGTARRYDAANRDWLRSPRVPTLYLHGAGDGCLSPGFAERAAQHLPDGSETGLVADAGHFLHLEKPGEVNARIANFIGHADGAPSAD
ncbi:MAG: alpha/beta fold hydrolase [Actinophytocola sp.]|nr:alpha/beta fold hydrolase [Actinophytocola sp.]